LIWSVTSVSVITAARYDVIYLAVSNFFQRVWSLRTFGAIVKVLDSDIQVRMATLGAGTDTG